jgi:ZIP family zinc transporter
MPASADDERRARYMPSSAPWTKPAPPHAPFDDAGSEMIEAFLWGALGASALVVGAVLAYAAKPSVKVIAVTMALGTGLLIGSVSFELVDDAIDHADVASVGLFTLVGALVFTAGNWWIQRRGGADRKDSAGAQASGSPLAIVLGSVLDGIPESFVLGLTVLEGQVSVALLTGILLSNLPEGLSSSAGLRIAHWPQRRVIRMWLIVVAVSAVSAAAGYALLDEDGGRAAALIEAFAAGALLAMVADTLLPEAFDVEGIYTGSLVTIGFAISIMLSAI